MGRILYTDEIGFDMEDWKSRDFLRVAAGSGCVMALDSDGVVRIKSRAEEQRREEFSFWKRLLTKPSHLRVGRWENVRDLAVSGESGVAAGLLENGTCVLERLENCPLGGREFRNVSRQVSSWNNLVDLAVSDAVFGLDSFGRVSCVPLMPLLASYQEVQEWRNIVRMIPGERDLLFGITSDGRIVAAGALSQELKRAIEPIRDAVDLAFAGERVLVAYKDNTVRDLHSGKVEPCLCLPGMEIAKSGPGQALICDGNGILHWYRADSAAACKVFGDRRVRSFAAGMTDGRRYVCAVAADQ